MFISWRKMARLTGKAILGSNICSVWIYYIIYYIVFIFVCIRCMVCFNCMVSAVFVRSSACGFPVAWMNLLAYQSVLYVELPPHVAYSTCLTGQYLVTAPSAKRPPQVVPQGRICSGTCCHTDFLPQPVTAYWHRASQSQRWLHNHRCLAG